MPPSPARSGDGGNAVQAELNPATTEVAGHPARKRLRLTELVKSSSRRPRETASIGIAPMREPNGSSRLAGAGECDMSSSRAISALTIAATAN